MRVFVGFLVQPIVAAAYGFLAFPIVDATGRMLEGGHTPEPTQAAVAFGLGTGLVAVFVMVFGGLPLFMWLRRRGPITMTKTLVSGALLGNLPTLVIIVWAALRTTLFDIPPRTPSTPHGTLQGLIRLTLFGTSVGLTCSAVIWWIAGRHLNRGA